MSPFANRSRTVSLLVVAIFGLASSTAKPQGLLPRRTLFAESDLLSVAVSGDAARLALVVQQPGGSKLLLATPSKPDERHALTLPEGLSPTGCQFTPDNRHLLVTCQTSGAARLVVFDPETGVAEPCGRDLEGSLELVRFTADPAPGIVVLQRGSQKRLRYYLAAAANEPSVLLLETNDFDRVLFDAGAAPRAATRQLASGATELLRRDGQGWTTLHTMAEDLTNGRRLPRAGVAAVVGLDDSTGELLTIDNTDRDRSQLVAWNLASGTSRVVAEDAQADLTPNPIVDRHTGRVLAVSAYFGELRRHVVAPEARDDLAFLEQQFGCAVGFSNVGLSDAAWLVAPLDGGPLRFHVYHRSQRSVTPVADSITGLKGARLARRTAHRVTTRDGLVLPCHLYLADRLDANGDGRPERPGPALLYIHGGPSIANPWDNWLTNRNLQLLADRGYAVVNVDFRGAGGYGREFVRQIWRQWGRGSVADLEDLARWAIDEKIAAPGRVGLWGWSYGGLATLSALAFSPETFACGISLYGLSDMEAFAKYASLGVTPQDVHERIGNPTTPEGAAALRALSPLFAADQMRRPILLTHGAQDLVAPRLHSDRLAEALQALGQPVVYLLYPREGHDYRRGESWISFWAVAEAFLQQHLEGDCQPPGTDLSAPPFQVIAGADQLAAWTGRPSPGS